MTKAHTWTLTGLGLIALVVGALLASGAIGSAQEGTTTPTPAATDDSGTDESTPTPSQSDDSTGGDTESDDANSGDTESEDADSGDSESGDTSDDRGCSGGGKHLIKEAAAEVLGMTEDELREQLQSGQTLAQIAEAQGMNVEDFRTALETAVRADLQAELDAGEITQEQFDEISGELDTRLDEAINSTGGLGFHGGPRGGDSEGTETGAGFREPFQSAPTGTDA